MANGVEIGTAYLTIAASTRGFVADIGKSLAQGEKLAASSGKAMGQAIKQGIESAQPVDTSKLTGKLEQDQKKLTATVEQSARKRSEAARQVEIAEQRLQEIQETGKAKQSQIMAAEDKVTKAREKYVDISRKGASDIKLFSDQVAASKADLEKAEKANKDLAASMEKVDGEADSAKSGIKGFASSVKQSLAGFKDSVKGSVTGAFKPVEDEAERSAKQAGNSFTSSFKGVIGGLGVYMGASEIFGGLKDSIMKAGDLEQSIGAVDSVFKDSAGQMHAWAEQAASSVGLSENSYNELASTLGASLKNAGTPMEELGGKTNDLIGLGADLSSMFGGTTTEAIEAVSSALRGETDPIEKYGISLNDAALTAKGLEMGIEKTGGAFTTQQKQLITQALLFEQAADAQGNFAREGDTFQGKLQRASAQWDNLKTTIGEAFLPVLTNVMGFISESVIPGIAGLGDSLRAVGEFFRPVFDFIVQTTPYWSPFAIGIGLVAGAFAIWTGATWALTAATGALSGVMAFLTSPITLVIAAIGLLVGGLIWAYQNVGWFRDLVQSAWGQIQLAIGFVVDWWTTTAWPAIQNGLQVLGQWFMALWTTYVVPAWNGIVAVISQAWTLYIQPVLMAVWGFIQNYLAPIFMWLWQSIIVPVFNGIVAVLTWAWNTIIIPLLGFVVAFVRDVLAPIFMWLWQNIITPVWNGIVLVIQVAWSIIKMVFGLIYGFLTGVLGPVFVWLWEKVISPVWSWISDKISSTWTWLRDNVFKPFGDALGTLADVFTRTKDGIGTAWDDLKAKVQEPVKFVVDTVINNGLISGYNKLNDFWSGKDLDPIKLGFARGGVIPGYQSQKKDEVLTPMRKGEGVIVPEATRVLGHGFIHGLNGAANRGGKAGASSWLNQNFGQGYAKGGVISPLKQRFPLSQGYNRVHKGIDIAAPTGTPIYATADGAVTHAGAGARAPGVWGGNEIHVKSGGIERWFAHLSEIAVRAGQYVKQGDYLGKSGNTGISSGPHLHFGVFSGGWPNDLNPLDYLGGAVNFDSSDTSGTGGGGGGFSIMSYVAEMLSSPVRALIGSAKEKFGGNGFAQIPFGFAEKMLDQVVEWVGGEHGGNESSGGSSANWTPTVKEALGRAGLPVRDDYVSAWMRQIQSESGGNPRAVQNGYTDVNTLTGDLAQGLVQVIGSTFRAYRDPSLPNDRFNPLANLTAGMRYAKARYGANMLGVIGQGHGYARGGIIGERPGLYDQGGLIQGKGLRLIDHQRNTPDYVLTDSQWSAMYEIAERQSAQGGQNITVNVPEREGIDPSQMGTRIAESMAFEFTKLGV